MALPGRHRAGDDCLALARLTERDWVVAGMNREQRLAETFVELADTLVADFDVIEFLQVLAARCVELLDVAAAGLVLVVAASDERARLLELFEVQSDEGPCRDCYALATAVVNADLDGARARWPRFAPRAIEAGFSSANALPLRLRSQVIGSLSLFLSGRATWMLNSCGWPRRWPTRPRSGSCSSARSGTARSRRRSCRRR